MDNLDVRSATLDELVAAYVEAAADYGRLSDADDFRNSNLRADQIASIYRELRERGPQAQAALTSLLRHSDNHVRSWAGAHALEFAPQEGERVLIELAKSSTTTGLNASMTLREWRRGTLRFP
jgi:hypothetical protein